MFSSGSPGYVGANPYESDPTSVVFGRVIAASDESMDGRHAVQVARCLADSSGEHITILTVLPVPLGNDVPAGRLLTSGSEGVEPVGGPELERFQTWLGTDPIPKAAGGRVAETAAAFGVPGIEITRLAEWRSATLIVLGRRSRGPDRRLLLGATADAVVRRSDTPVLFAPVGTRQFRRVLVALDGTDRCVSVLETAHRFATHVGAAMTAVHVHLDQEEVLPGAAMPRARRARLDELVRRLGQVGGEPVTLERRKGDPIEEVLTAASAHHADVLVIGYRRGGLPKVFGRTDIARSLLYAAPTAVLTVPL